MASVLTVGGSRVVVGHGEGSSGGALHGEEECWAMGSGNQAVLGACSRGVVDLHAQDCAFCGFDPRSTSS